jgi:hypothetical protein
VLTPTWLAIGVFVALPFWFAIAVAAVVDRLDRPGSFAKHGRARWIVGAICVALFPPTLVLLAVAAMVLIVWVTVREAWRHDGAAGVPRGVAIVIRGAWLGVAVLGLVALVDDIRQIAAVT